MERALKNIVILLLVTLWIYTMYIGYINVAEYMMIDPWDGLVFVLLVSTVITILSKICNILLEAVDAIE